MVCKVVLLSIALLFCVFNLCNNFGRIVSKFYRFEKETQTKFIHEKPPFPAVTVCNLNPFKRSVAKNDGLFHRLMRVFEEANMKFKPRQPDKSNPQPQLKYEPFLVSCQCSNFLPESTCRPILNSRIPDEKYTCLCAFDRFANNAWPCHPMNQWYEAICSECNLEGYCTKNQISNGTDPCYCVSHETFCMRKNVNETEPVKYWEHFLHADVAASDPAVVEALGFQGLNELSILSQAKENLLFVGAEFRDYDGISQSLNEFVESCSFDGKDCDMKSDFTMIVDPIYGNCFTFNHDQSTNMISSDSGLDLLLNVDLSEYLPTTQESGVVLTVHDKGEYPFPDALGRKAPAGSLSTFKINLKKHYNLPAPYGDCVADKDMNRNIYPDYRNVILSDDTDDYIYPNYKYSLDGCYRSCLQQIALQTCGCGYPAYPVPNGFHICQAADPVARKCLNHVTTKHDKFPASDCNCKEPCRFNSYSVSYSAVQWPTESSSMMSIKCGSLKENATEYENCIEDFRKNHVMVKVYYETDNFETIQEYASYTFYDMASDLIGGLPAVWFFFTLALVSLLVLLMSKCSKNKNKSDDDAVVKVHTFDQEENGSTKVHFDPDEVVYVGGKIYDGGKVYDGFE